jgi:hypothetical protein
MGPGLTRTHALLSVPEFTFSISCTSTTAIRLSLAPRPDRSSLYDVAESSGTGLVLMRTHDRKTCPHIASLHTCAMIVIRSSA